MGAQEKMDREINLKELFWNILFEWRQLICFGIIFAILFVGVKFLRDTRTYHAIQDAEEEEYDFTEEEEKQISDARELIEQVAGYQEYLKSSVALQIDPYKENLLRLQYYVESDYIINYTKDNKRDYTGDIVGAYNDYIVSGDMIRRIIEMADLEISEEDFSELCRTTLDGTSITISIIHPKKEALADIAEAIKTLLLQKETEFQKIGSHTLNLVGESQKVVVDSELRERKTTILNSMLNLNIQLNTLKASMTEVQKRVLDEYDRQEKEIKEETQSAAVKPIARKEFLLFGAFIGIFLVCIWVICKTILTAKIQNAEEIHTLYGVRLLGEVENQLNKKRFLSIVDEKLLAVKNRGKKKLSLEQQIKIVVTNIVLFCKQKEIFCIYMTGSEYENADSSILKIIKEQISNQGIEVKEGGNIFYDAESLKLAAEVGNILFIEQKGQSIYNEIYNELYLAKEQNSCVLGVVVLT